MSQSVIEQQGTGHASPAIRPRPPRPSAPGALRRAPCLDPRWTAGLVETAHCAASALASVAVVALVAVGCFALGGQP